MKTTADIVSLCRACVDLIVPASQDELSSMNFEPGSGYGLPRAQMDTLINTLIPRGRHIPGGSTANSLAVLSALGTQTAFIGKVGNDALGEKFSQDFKDRGVAFDTQPADDGGTACCIIFVTPDDERTFVFNPRVSDDMTREDIEYHQDTLRNSKVVFFGLTYCNPDCEEIVDLACHYAPDAKIAVSLQSYEVGNAYAAGRMMQADILIANETEFQNLLSDMGVDHLQQLAKIDPSKILVCTKGQQGAVIIQGDNSITVAAQPVDQIQDTVGAGDAWAAGFLHGFLSDQFNLKKAGELGAACAAQILQSSGGRPPLSEIATYRHLPQSILKR